MAYKIQIYATMVNGCGVINLFGSFKHNIEQARISNPIAAKH